MREQYTEVKLRKSTLAVVEAANGIIHEYQAAGFTLTLRQLYYQFVARGLLANQQREYKRLGEIVSAGRLAGLISWEAIEDRTRSLRSSPTWEDPADIIEAAAQSFRIDKWRPQKHRPEVWIEKDALVGVVEPACTRAQVPYFACRGYTSQSEAWGAAKRFVRHIRAGQKVVLIHLGDHDPSGIDMTRDIEDRLDLFLRGHGYSLGRHWNVLRIALNMDQVEAHNPPPNPAKMTDSRFGGYAARFGDESWELDALDPRTIDELITDTIAAYRNDDLWAEKVDEEAAGRDRLHEAVEWIGPGQPLGGGDDDA